MDPKDLPPPYSAGIGGGAAPVNSFVPIGSGAQAPSAPPIGSGAQAPSAPPIGSGAQAPGAMPPPYPAYPPYPTGPGVVPPPYTIQQPGVAQTARPFTTVTLMDGRRCGRWGRRWHRRNRGQATVITTNDPEMQRQLLTEVQERRKRAFIISTIFFIFMVAIAIVWIILATR